MGACFCGSGQLYIPSPFGIGNNMVLIFHNLLLSHDYQHHGITTESTLCPSHNVIIIVKYNEILCHCQYNLPTKMRKFGFHVNYIDIPSEIR
jgi:hypothetical protein